MRLRTLGSALFICGVLASGAVILSRADHVVPEFLGSDAALASRAVPLSADLPPIEPSDALVTAAFGLEALQPETYDRELVLDILEAAPLDGHIKTALEEDLVNAESGKLPLPAVLRDVRLALSID